MANSITGGATQNVAPDMTSQFNQFRNQFRGDPHQRVMQMLQAGQITQQQLDSAIAMARQLQGSFK